MPPTPPRAVCLPSQSQSSRDLPGPETTNLLEFSLSVWPCVAPAASRPPSPAGAPRVFLPPLPHPILLYPDHANRALAIRNVPAAENRVRPLPPYRWVYPAGSRMLPVANRCQFALAPDAPAPHPQNSPVPGAQLPAHGRAWPTGSFPLPPHSHYLE